MSDLVSNRLRFLTNAKTILAYIRAKNPKGSAPSQFSLDSIKPMPNCLNLPLTVPIKTLSQLNADLPPLDENTKQVALTKLFSGKNERLSNESLIQKITELRSSVTPSDLGSFEQAVINFQQYDFFSAFDWRLHHWGTVSDIQSVIDATFVPSTTALEFTTCVTPPIAALQTLANTFPSVRFELSYRYLSQATWQEIEFFPFPPFSY